MTPERPLKKSTKLFAALLAAMWWQLISAPAASAHGLPPLPEESRTLLTTIGLVVLPALGVVAAAWASKNWRRNLPAVVSIVGLVAAGLTLSSVTASAHHTVDPDGSGLPDLISQSPVPYQAEEIVWADNEIRVLKFDGFVTNIGSGPFDLYGNPQDQSVYQRVWDGSEWENVGQPLVQYENTDGHEHWHLMEIMRYSLWNEDKSAQVAPGAKIGFCLTDSESVGGPGGPIYPEDCGYRQPGLTELHMGISAGYKDVYGGYLALQWIDVSNLTPGFYHLAAESDPFNRIVESNEGNNGFEFSERTAVPGYTARSVGPLDVGGDIDIELQANKFTQNGETEPGLLEFYIASLPEHGSINFSIDERVRDYTVTYTPDPGYEGPDSFDFYARDKYSRYPLDPKLASVSLDVGSTGTAPPPVDEETEPEPTPTPIPEEDPVDGEDGDSADGDDEAEPEPTATPEPTPTPEPEEVELNPNVVLDGAVETVFAGTALELNAVLTDAPDAVTVWSVNGIAGGAADIGTISPEGMYQAPADISGEFGVTIRAALDTDQEIFDEIRVTVTDAPNEAPTITNPGDQANRTGEEVGVYIEAVDPDGNPLTYTATGLPRGIEISETTGLIAGMTAVKGLQTVTVTVSDGRDSVDVSFRWAINGLPRIEFTG